jgi:hypothetical protein
MLPRESIAWVTHFFEYGLTPPVAIYTVYALDSPLATRGITRQMLLASLAGLFYYAVAARALWAVGLARFRAERGPAPSYKLYRVALVERAAEETVTAAEPMRALPLQGAVLIEEEWSTGDPQVLAESQSTEDDPPESRP